MNLFDRLYHGLKKKNAKFLQNCHDFEHQIFVRFRQFWIEWDQLFYTKKIYHYPWPLASGGPSGALRAPLSFSNNHFASPWSTRLWIRNWLRPKSDSENSVFSPSNVSLPLRITWTKQKYALLWILPVANNNNYISYVLNNITLRCAALKRERFL